jgi:hypothetical protein
MTSSRESMRGNMSSSRVIKLILLGVWGMLRPHAGTLSIYLSCGSGDLPA